eukprot:gene1494-437_t
MSPASPATTLPCLLFAAAVTAQAAGAPPAHGIRLPPHAAREHAPHHVFLAGRPWSVDDLDPWPPGPKARVAAPDAATSVVHALVHVEIGTSAGDIEACCSCKVHSYVPHGAFLVLTKAAHLAECPSRCPAAKAITKFPAQAKYHPRLLTSLADQPHQEGLVIQLVPSDLWGRGHTTAPSLADRITADLLGNPALPLSPEWYPHLRVWPACKPSQHHYDAGPCFAALAVGSDRLLMPHLPAAIASKVLAHLAEHPLILGIAARETFRPVNDGARDITGVSAIPSTNPSLRHPKLDGLGQVVGVADTGVRIGSCFFDGTADGSSTAAATNFATREIGPVVSLSWRLAWQTSACRHTLGEFGNTTFPWNPALRVVTNSTLMSQVDESQLQQEENLCVLDPLGCHRKFVMYDTKFGDQHDKHGHGSHVVGTIAGDPAWSRVHMEQSGVEVDTAGPGFNITEDIESHHGIAPLAKIAFNDLEGPQGSFFVPVAPPPGTPSCGIDGYMGPLQPPCTASDTRPSATLPYLLQEALHEKLFPRAVLAGAHIHSNSWGSGAIPSDGGNNLNVHAVDTFAYENPDVLLVFAAGNEGRSGLHSMLSPAEAKNVLTVGASQNHVHITLPEHLAFPGESGVADSMERVLALSVAGHDEMAAAADQGVSAHKEVEVMASGMADVAVQLYAGGSGYSWTVANAGGMPDPEDIRNVEGPWWQDLVWNASAWPQAGTVVTVVLEHRRPWEQPSDGEVVPTLTLNLMRREASHRHVLPSLDLGNSTVGVAAGFGPKLEAPMQEMTWLPAPTGNEELCQGGGNPLQSPPSEDGTIDYNYYFNSPAARSAFEDVGDDDYPGLYGKSHPLPYNNTVLIARRGECNFVAKVLWGQLRGAAAVVIVNNQDGPPSVMGGAEGEEKIIIPSLMIRKDQGEALLDELENMNGTVVASLEPADVTMKDDLHYGPANLADFSSRGPTFDGRTKPDIVAPGEMIFSADNHQECGLRQMSGTSMATPVTAGVASLMRQYYVDGFHPSGAKSRTSPPGSPDPDDSMLPSAALLKATLVSGALPLRGLVNIKDDKWGNLSEMSDSHYYIGHGLINLPRSVYVSGEPFVPPAELPGGYLTAPPFVRDRQLLKKEGDVLTYCFSVSADQSQEPFTASLVWTDPPAAIGAHIQLVHDVDLVVITPDKRIHYGNGHHQRGANFSAYPDRLNNIERVDTVATQAGLLTVAASAASLPLGQQDFALHVRTSLQSVPCPEHTDLCPLDCGRHGSCHNFVCRCNHPYYGPSCSDSPALLPSSGGAQSSTLTGPAFLKYFKFDAAANNMSAYLSAVGHLPHPRASPVQILVARGYLPTRSAHDFHNNGTDGDPAGSIHIAQMLAMGTWFVGVSTFECCDPVEFTLTSLIYASLPVLPGLSQVRSGDEPYTSQGFSSVVVAETTWSPSAAALQFRCNSGPSLRCQVQPLAASAQPSWVAEFFGPSTASSRDGPPSSTVSLKDQAGTCQHVPVSGWNPVQGLVPLPWSKVLIDALHPEEAEEGYDLSEFTLVTAGSSYCFGTHADIPIANATAAALAEWDGSAVSIGLDPPMPTSLHNLLYSEEDKNSSVCVEVLACYTPSSLYSRGSLQDGVVPVSTSLTVSICPDQASDEARWIPDAATNNAVGAVPTRPSHLLYSTHFKWASFSSGHVDSLEPLSCSPQLPLRPYAPSSDEAGADPTPRGPSTDAPANPAQPSAQPVAVGSTFDNEFATIAAISCLGVGN